MELIIGNKNYSSWSLRPWILMRALGIPFTERLIRLDAADFSTRLAAVYDGSTVPVLVDGDTVVWESLAIIEYLAERFPDSGIWPKQREARAMARAISAEMHAGFSALRSACPMNLGKRYSTRDRGDDCAADVDRVCGLWQKARDAFGERTDHPYLFGPFCAADAMFVPVVTRLNTYSIAVPDNARAYMEAILCSEPFADWREAALSEPWTFAEDEVDEDPIEDLRHSTRPGSPAT